MNRPKPKAYCGDCGGITGTPEHDDYCLSYNHGKGNKDIEIIYLTLMIIAVIFIFI